MAMHQASWNAYIGTPCEFVLLNPPSKRGGGQPQEGVDLVRVDSALGDTGLQLGVLKRMLERTSPRGPTPLADRLREIHARIERELTQLSCVGHRVVLVIATDGLPTGTYGLDSTNEKAKVALLLRRMLVDLPLHIVIRLTTDSEEVVEYYNKLDEELELPLEVIDDIESEAQEIADQGNRWLTYSPLIHTMREGGTFVKLFDLLDERRLTPVESLVLARLLLQSEAEEHLPHDASDFCNYAEERLSQLDYVYDPLRRRMRPRLDVLALRRTVVPLRLFHCCCRRRPPLKPVPTSWWRRQLGGSRAYDKLQPTGPPASQSTTPALECTLGRSAPY